MCICGVRGLGENVYMNADVHRGQRHQGSMVTGSSVKLTRGRLVIISLDLLGWARRCSSEEYHALVFA